MHALLLLMLSCGRHHFGLTHGPCWSKPFYITSLLQFLHADAGSFMACRERLDMHTMHKLEENNMLATSYTTLCLLQANKEKYCGILCKSGRDQDGLLTSNQSCLLQMVVLREALRLCESFCGSCIEYTDSLLTI